MILQACQNASLAKLQSPQKSASNSCDPVPTLLSDPDSNQHITLTSPHTVLLMSTVRGGVAYRGAFTGAIATQLSSSDGNTDIYSMYNQAVTAMKADGQYIDQNPKLEIVTNKKLVLQSARHT